MSTSIALVLGVAAGLSAGFASGLAARFAISRSATRAPDGHDAGKTVDRAADKASDTASGADSEMSASLREALEYVEIGVLVIDATGEIRYRNAAAEEFRGTHAGVLVDEHVAAVVAAARAGGRSSTTVELQGPPKFWLEISADAVPDGGTVATIRDVSERVRADTMRSDFVTNVTHELRTPVGAIAVLAEALVDESDPVTIHRVADRLVHDAHRAVRTVDDLLELAQIESTRPRDDIVSMASVMQRAIARGRIADAGRGVEIAAPDVADTLVLRADERQLLSAIGNLVENAVKYSNPGDVVRVGATVDAAAIEVTVADRGVGIPARDLDRVFERFYRVDKARSRETGGTGLGLAIVRHVATNHGGDVRVSSQEGEGSTFVLRLPASLVVPADHRADHTDDHTATGAGAS